MDHIYAQVRVSPTIVNLKQGVEIATHSLYQIKHGDLYWRDRLVIPHDNP